MYVLRWPKVRDLTDDDGRAWRATVTPGALLLFAADGTAVSFTDPGELRAFAMQVYAAAIDHDGAVQQAAVLASLERRRARGTVGNRHRPVVERPEPPMHMEVPA